MIGFRKPSAISTGSSKLSRNKPSSKRDTSRDTRQILQGSKPFSDHIHRLLRCFRSLSFLTSVFGMNTLEWGGGNDLSLSTIFSIGIPISVTLIAWIIAEGAGYGHARQWVKRAKRRLSKMMPVALRRRQKASKKTTILKLQRKEIINPDFWERHRLERGGRYETPLGNRKGALFERARRMAAKAKENWGMEPVEQSDDSVSEY